MKQKESAQAILEELMTDLTTKGIDPKIVKKAFMLGVVKFRTTRPSKTDKNATTE